VALLSAASVQRIGLLLSVFGLVLRCDAVFHNNVKFSGKILDCFQCCVNLNNGYVEIKCQLDATEVFIAHLIACSTCFGHHHAHHQELKSIIQWLLRVVFCAVKM